MNNNYKNIKSYDVSKANLTDDSAYLDNTKNEKLNLNNKKQGTKRKASTYQYKNQFNNKNKKSDEKEKNTDLSNISDLPPTTQRTDRTTLEKKMDSAIEYISNLNEEHIFDYTKSVIRDFLIFIKKVTSSNNEKEDLDCHFKVIIKILENIYNQMEKLSFNLDYDTLNQFIPEEIFIQTFKIIIVAPCFLLDIENYLLTFIKKLRKIISNDLKFFEIYFEILNKFICFEKGSSFLQGVNSKNTFIVFYDFFLLNDPAFEEVEILKKFESHIKKNIFFTEDEKLKYLKEFRQSIKVLEITQKNNEGENKDEYEQNLHEISNKIDFNENNEDDENENDDHIMESKVIISNNNLSVADNKSSNKKINSIFKKQSNVEEEKDNSNQSISRFKDNLRDDKKNLEEEEEDMIINNYSKIIKNKIKENLVIASDYREEDKEIYQNDTNYHIFKINQNMKSHSFKNFDNYSNLNKENIYKTERSQTNEKVSENIVLPENLDKDILKIKDSIKEKCRKLDMNIKRINNKIENEINPHNKNVIYDKNSQNQTTNLNTNMSNISVSQNDNTMINRLNDYKNKIQGNYNSYQQIDNNNQNFKPRRNLEQLEEIESFNDVTYYHNQDHNSDFNNNPKMNNFLQNRTNNIQVTNRLEEINFNSNQMYNSNQNIDTSQKVIYNNDIQNRINYNNKNSNSNSHNSRNDIVNLEEIKKLILKIPSIILDDCVSEISHYVALENFFMKMNSETKIEFTNFLYSSINNSSLIKTSSFNCFLQLLEFLLTLLIFVRFKFILLFSYLISLI